MRNTIDLSVMPAGKRYEDTYGAYLEIFRRIAETPAAETVYVISPPVCWVPLLTYLGALIVRPARRVFEHDEMLEPMVKTWLDNPARLNRTAVEVLCGFRPELVDALWKCDMEWKTDRVRNEGLRDFIVTTNGAFHRKEVLVYLERLREYEPTKKKCVLIPCAADKPYPSPLHQAVLDILPDDYELITATGVLGLVLQALWPIMPYYDSEIPNEWRLFNMAREYFSRHAYYHVIAYTDFYSNAIGQALGVFAPALKLDFIDPPVFRTGYLDLMAPQRLAKLNSLFIKGEPRMLMFE